MGASGASNSRMCSDRWLSSRAIVIGLAMLLQPGTVAYAVVPRVAVVFSSQLGPFVEAGTALQAALRASVVQPEVLTFDLDGKRENGPTVLAQVRAATPALIMPVGTLATSVVVAEPWPVPIVFAMVLYPYQSGFVGSTRPDVTGASLDVPFDEQFGLLTRLAPKVQRIGIVSHPEETGTVVKAARQAAEKAGLRLEVRDVDKPENAVPVFEKLLTEVDAMIAVADSHVFTAETTGPLILAALRERVPLLGLSAAQVRSGALAALTSDYAENGRQAAVLAVRVLQGERAGSIAPTVPQHLSVTLNARTADHLGLTVDPALERNATTVIH
jgi:putative ABC transport system substrate-binding protein